MPIFFSSALPEYMTRKCVYVFNKYITARFRKNRIRNIEQQSHYFVEYGLSRSLFFLTLFV